MADSDVHPSQVAHSGNDFIVDFWETQPKPHGPSHQALLGDSFMIALEIATIGKHLKDGDTVLDAGCANGHSASCSWVADNSSI